MVADRHIFKIDRKTAVVAFLFFMPVDFVPTHTRQHAKGSFERRCRICQRTRGVIRSYRLNICRRCFRERAEILGFKKYD